MHVATDTYILGEPCIRRWMDGWMDGWIHENAYSGTPMLICMYARPNGRKVCEYSTGGAISQMKESEAKGAWYVGRSFV